MVKAVVAAGGDLNLTSSDGATPFLLAVAWMDEERISALLSLGGDATKVDSRRRGALHYAVVQAQDATRYGGHREEDETMIKLGALFRTLLAAGADPKQAGALKLEFGGSTLRERVTPIVAIISLGQNILPSERYNSPKNWKVVSEVVRALFSVSDLSAQLRDEHLLTLCVSWAPIEFVLQLLDSAELNLDQKGLDGDTPLIRALIVLSEPTPTSANSGTIMPPPPTRSVLPQGHAPDLSPIGAAIRALEVLSKANAPVSEILVSMSLVAVRKFVEGSPRDIVRAAIELNSHARSGLSADACVAMRRLHAAKVSLSYVLLAKTENGARAVALSARGPGDLQPW